jgi:hypothetical protein
MNIPHYIFFYTIVYSELQRYKKFTRRRVAVSRCQDKSGRQQRQKKERKALKAEFEAIVRPKPNSSFLGFRPKLFIYKIAGTQKTKGFRYWLKPKWEKHLFIQ